MSGIRRSPARRMPDEVSASAGSLSEGAAPVRTPGLREPPRPSPCCHPERRRSRSQRISPPAQSRYHQVLRYIPQCAVGILRRFHLLRMTYSEIGWFYPLSRGPAQYSSKSLAGFQVRSCRLRATWICSKSLFTSFIHSITASAKTPTPSRKIPVLSNCILFLLI